MSRAVARDKGVRRRRVWVYGYGLARARPGVPATSPPVRARSSRAAAGLAALRGGCVGMRVQRCKGSMRRVWVSAWGLFIGGGSACCTDAPALKGARPKASWGFVENKRGFIANNFRQQHERGSNHSDDMHIRHISAAWRHASCISTNDCSCPGSGSRSSARDDSHSHAKYAIHRALHRLPT